MRREPDQGVVVATALWEPWLAGGLCLALLSGAGWLLQFSARMLGRIPLGPIQDVLRAAAAAPLPQIGFWVGAGLGAIVVLALASDRIMVTVTPQVIRFGRSDRGTAVERDRIGAVFVEDQVLVVLGFDGEQLARERYDASRPQTLRDALIRFEYPWSNGRPRPSGGPWSA